jgi:hypothetical protein
MGSSSEIFFRRKETAREQVSLPAPLFNRCILLLHRATTAHVFVPVRTMQILAVIDTEEIIFVDNLAYAVEKGHGGRLIVLAWEFKSPGPRDSLTEPVPIEVVYYGPERHEIHRRLLGEFTRALDRHEAILAAGRGENKTATILPFTPESTRRE